MFDLLSRAVKVSQVMFIEESQSFAWWNVYELSLDMYLGLRSVLVLVHKDKLILFEGQAWGGRVGEERLLVTFFHVNHRNLEVQIRFYQKKATY